MSKTSRRFNKKTCCDDKLLRNNRGRSQPHSLGYATLKVVQDGYTLCPDNGGNSGPGYLSCFAGIAKHVSIAKQYDVRPAAPRTIQRSRVCGTLTLAAPPPALWNTVPASTLSLHSHSVLSCKVYNKIISVCQYAKNRCLPEFARLQETAKPYYIPAPGRSCKVTEAPGSTAADCSPHSTSSAAGPA